MHLNSPLRAPLRLARSLRLTQRFPDATTAASPETPDFGTQRPRTIYVDNSRVPTVVSTQKDEEHEKYRSGQTILQDHYCTRILGISSLTLALSLALPRSFLLLSLSWHHFLPSSLYHQVYDRLVALAWAHLLSAVALATTAGVAALQFGWAPQFASAQGAGIPVSAICFAKVPCVQKYFWGGRRRRRVAGEIYIYIYICFSSFLLFACKGGLSLV